MTYKKLKNVDLRKLKDSFFKGVENDNVLCQKATLLILCEYTTPNAKTGVTEKFIKSKVDRYTIDIIAEYQKRQGLIEAKYNKNGKITTMKLTEKGLENAKKLVKKLTIE